MTVAPYTQLLEAAKKQRRDTNIAPVAVSVTLLPGYDPHADNTLFEPSVLLAPCPHPTLEAFLETSGALRRGRMSWAVGLGENYTPEPMRVLTTRLMPGTLFHESDAATSKAPKVLTKPSRYAKVISIVNDLRGTRAWQDQDAIEAVAGQDYPTTGPGRFGAVTVSASNGVLWMKVVTNNLDVPDDLGLPGIPLNLRPAGRSFTEPKPVRPVDAVAVLDWLVAQGVTLVDTSDNHALAVLRDRVAKSVVATPTPGRPAMAEVSVGRALFRTPGLTLPLLPVPDATQASARGQMSALDVAALSRALPEGAAVVHPGTADIGAMALAAPVEDDRLRGYQREAVGLHAATSLGFLDCVAPGMGKTVMQYAGMQRRAAAVTAYRGLVVAEANVRTQWVSEAADWFPEATVVAIESRSDAARLAETLTSPGPVVVVTSYGLLPAVTEELTRREAFEYPGPKVSGPTGPAGSPTGPAAHVDAVDVVDVTLPEGSAAAAVVEAGQLDLFTLFAPDPAAEVPADVTDVDDAPVPTLGALLLDTAWHDIAADEAEVLRGTGSKQAQAMWELRARAQVGVVLTGTPINRGVDDLGRLISWARNDRHLFHGVSLSKQFNIENGDEAELAEFLEAMGPLLFRRDSSEIADELPTIIPTVMKLTPSAAEKALAHAARAELKRVYLELLAWIEMVEAADPGNPTYVEARNSLKEARGAWLGGTQLARMASSDPAALLGSQSAGAALLAGQGLIEAATQVAGTKRTVMVGEVLKRVARGERVLIFTEFATVATGIIDDLDAGGARVGGVLGGGGRRRDQNIAAFKRGDLDVLVCTQSGEKGLNLQEATTIVHYDLPWTPKGVIQRTGRAMRIKSKNKTVEVIFPLMEGTIEERVASLVVSRAVEAMRALDASRGVDTSQTEMGLALGGLVDAVHDGTVADGDGLMALTHALVA